MLANCCRGRVLGTRGQAAAAEAAFEAAYEEAERYELPLLSAFAMRDLVRNGAGLQPPARVPPF